MEKLCFLLVVFYESNGKNIIEEKEAKSLLSWLGLKTPLRKIPLHGDVLISICIRYFDYIILNVKHLLKM